MADVWFEIEEIKELVTGNTIYWINSSVTSSNENTYITVYIVI